MKLNPYKACQLFLSLKQHFNSKSYDCFKYNFKVNLSYDSYDKRRDKYAFEKLSRHKDPVGLIVSNIIENDVSWANDLFSEEAQETYLRWTSKKQSLLYNFKQDISKLEDYSIKDLFKGKSGDHPTLLKLYKQGLISTESLVILNRILRVFEVWDKQISETTQWPRIRDKCLKYDPFIKCDMEKYKSVIKTYLNNHADA